jgi:hypothetical protein
MNSTFFYQGLVNKWRGMSRARGSEEWRDVEVCKNRAILTGRNVLAEGISPG